MIRWNLVDRRNNKGKVDISNLSEDKIKGVREFHKSFHEYYVTPLHKLENLAKYYGLKNIFVKDESYRFNLNAFKVLGGAYAIGKYLSNKLDIDISKVSFEYFKSKEIREKLGDITFVTATDGNHGRGVAWAANQLGQKSVVYLPRVACKSRLEAIKREGGQASIIDGNYDDAVRLSKEMARKHGWVVIQDTAWEGYKEIPSWIMEGYGSLIHETMEQLKKEGIERPSHVFLQAGVGSFAASIQGYLANKFKGERPVTVIIEPDDANCLYKSSLSGERKIVTGDMPTIMAGLACGEPNIISYEILKAYSDGYLSCPDYLAGKAMRILAAPLKGDPQIIAGESGAIGIGVISEIMEKKEYKDLREKLKLDKDSTVLVISTEGDTDPEGYREIVWEGKHSR